MFRGKLVMVGAGFVGSTTAYTIMCGGLFNEIVIIDINRAKAEGDAMDMAHGVSFVKPVNVYSGDYSDCKDADIVVITAGANQKPGETRLDLLRKNAEIFKDIIGNIIRYAPDDVILLTVSNPVDILTYITYRISGLPKNQVIGSGTVLDTSRLKYMISRHTGVDARNCHTYIIGEHGDSEVAAWSITNIAGMSMREYAAATGKCTPNDLDDMYNRVKHAAYEIIEKKGVTYYAIALAVAKITACIAGEENSVLTVSSVFDGEYGIKDVAMSVPTQVSGYGIERIFEVPFDDREKDGLYNSAKTLRENLDEIKL
ncbi:MAG: L-lactate dehydrogenase [Oscillospiraceae bacterium]|nr:L-lactate dehydrogenase [Oscillospiraceae bacterium]